MDDILEQIQEGIYAGDTKYVTERTEIALRYGVSLDEIMQGALLPPMEKLGEKMSRHEVFVPEVLKASRAMHAALYVLRPLISHSSMHTRGIVVIGTVAGDLHDIGKNMVSMLLSGHGYTVMDLGIDVTKEQFAEAVVKYHPDVIAMSSLLTTTMYEMETVIKYLSAKNLRGCVKITVGGQPVTMDFAREIGADAYTQNAFEIMDAVDDLIAGRVGKYSTSYIWNKPEQKDAPAD